MPNKIRKLIEAVSKNKGKLMFTIGQLVINDAIQNFKDEAFEGNKWKPRKDSTSGEKRTDRRNLLVKSGRMRRSLRVTKQTQNSVTVGSDVPYAKIHNYGGIIKHPGGTPYLPFNQVYTKRKKKGRIDKMGDSQMVFIKKDGTYPEGTRFTKPHTIRIPQRQFIGITPKLKEKIKQKILEMLFKVK